VILLDGGLSTALEQLGNTLNTSLWSGELLRSHGDQIRSAHQLFVDAGAHILITSSYQITFDGCVKRGWSEEEVVRALQDSTQLARFDGVKVAASVGPYGAYLADGSEYRGNYGLSRDQLKDFHRRRLEILISTNPDYLAIETIPELTEARAILELVQEINLLQKVWISFSCRNESEISSGESFASAVELANKFSFVEAVGINCAAPLLITPLLSSANSSIPFIVYPNSGRVWDAELKVWNGPTSGSFEKSDLDQWKKLGATIIGGCCGVSPDDISEIKPMIG
jgi:homocysteine S-methyltransferase